MANYDPVYVELVTDVLDKMGVLDETITSYEDRLRQLQGVLTKALQTGAEPLSDEAEQAVRQAVGRIDPHPDDQYQEGPTMLRRLQVAVDLELFKWTSAMVQPAGPSGEIAVAEPQTIPAGEGNG